MNRKWQNLAIIGSLSFIVTFSLGLKALAQTSASVPQEEIRAFADKLFPILKDRCVHCHGQDGIEEGGINFLTLLNAQELIEHPLWIAKGIHAIEKGRMPPRGEPSWEEAHRRDALEGFRGALRESIAAGHCDVRTPIRRLNRFQYNNAVRDLLELTVDVFPIPERMLREYGNYFQPNTKRLPMQVKVGSRILGKSQMIEKHLGGATPFPQDLRAEHGYDNRGDHLSLSPMLMESFLDLGRTIVHSNDFHAKTCGIWNDFFEDPKVQGYGNLEAETRRRLRRFLTRGFRTSIDEATLDRYVQFVIVRIQAGGSYEDAMKEVAAAVITSPRFLYLYDEPLDPEIRERPSPRRSAKNLAARLSFFLWGSLPDEELRSLGDSGQLHELDVLSSQVDRMLHDRRMKRFCDSFPSQWLQLERIISAEPDPNLYPQFYFAKYRASMHMMMEPLLLFEAILVENRSILELIDSDFSYRSDLLEAWYRDGTQGKPGPPTEVMMRRVPIHDRREGGVITTAATMTMTSSPFRTKPITRGAWLATVILNDPPPPPPGNVPPLKEKPAPEEEQLTLRERFDLHRKQLACAGCHERIDPLGFALENYDPAGIWRNRYENGREIDPSGNLWGRHAYRDILEFKEALLKEKKLFTWAFAAHLLSFALGREMAPIDIPSLDRIVEETEKGDFRFHAMIHQIVLSDSFRR